MSPYNVDKESGGDTKENTKWLDSCVSSVMSKSKKDKSGAIAICKAQLKKKKNSSASQDLPKENNLEEYSSEDMMETDRMMEEEDRFLQACVKKLMDTGKAKTNDEALQMCRIAYEDNDMDDEKASIWIIERILY